MCVQAFSVYRKEIDLELIKIGIGYISATKKRKAQGTELKIINRNSCAFMSIYNFSRLFIC